jgi:hypothetical protein
VAAVEWSSKVASHDMLPTKWMNTTRYNA